LLLATKTEEKGQKREDGMATKRHKRHKRKQKTERGRQREELRPDNRMNRTSSVPFS
jgi:hypothetical protein